MFWQILLQTLIGIAVILIAARGIQLLARRRKAKRRP